MNIFGTCYVDARVRVTSGLATRVFSLLRGIFILGLFTGNYSSVLSDFTNIMVDMWIL